MYISTKQQAAARGFTLVEIAVVLVILGLLFTLLAGVATSLIAQQKRELTRSRLAGVEAALTLFVSQNQRLPCPADGTLVASAPNAGVELWAAGACTTTQANGVVPWRALGLAEQDITDGWANRMTYRVAPPLVALNAMNFTNCDPGGGGGLVAGACNGGCTSASFPGSCTPPQAVTATKGLTIKNLAGATVMDPTVSPSTGAAYVVVSHGENGAGAYSSEGILQAGNGSGGIGEEAKNFANLALGAGSYYVDDFAAYSPPYFDDFVLRPAILTVASKAQLGARAH